MKDDSTITTLKELLKSELITQEEYDMKVEQINRNENNETIKKDNSSSIDFEEIEKLKRLRDEGIIDDNDYSQKAAQLCNINVEKSEQYKKYTIGGWLKSNVIVLGIIIILCCATGLLYSKYLSQKTEIDKLNRRLTNVNEELDKVKESANRRLKYEKVVKNFYLDSAVLVVEGNKNYHRFNCPKIEDADGFWIYNSENAESQGYSKCKTCFGLAADTYASDYFGDLYY